MDFIGSDSDALELRPGLVFGAVDRLPRHDTRVRTDVACLLRVRRSAAPFGEDEELELQRAFVQQLPGSPDGAECQFTLRYRRMARWEEEQFAGEYRTRHPALARMYFRNGGSDLHLIDLSFYVPPFDPSQLEGAEAELDPVELAEQREAAAILHFHLWALERLDDFGDGVINQVVLPELWTCQVHLLPRLWALVAGFCRASGNRFFVASGAPPLSVLQQEERLRARAEGFELSDDELTVQALVPWYRAERWQRREDVPVEVALTLDALAASRAILARQEVTLSSIGVYWPWVQDLKGMLVPPTAAVSGVFARSDDENGPVGVMKPPANEEVKGILDLAQHIDEQPTNMLQREAVNLLHTRVGKGVVVWGARTLCEDPTWRFVNVRRLIGYIGKQIEFDNQWAVFESNDESLRQRVARDVRYFLKDLWEKGALQGEIPSEAFVVVCNNENNPQSVIDAGTLVVDVWVNPVQTNEFVHLKLTYGDEVVD
ncbi:MAG: hypothetical protein CMP23_02080 [Rickettsiales bacterium]|nr:hypothetical protein [Rickettsiales bacterium]